MIVILHEQNHIHKVQAVQRDGCITATPPSLSRTDRINNVFLFLTGKLYTIAEFYAV